MTTAVLAIELVTVWRGFDSLRGWGGGGGGKEGPMMTEIHIFLFSLFPQTGQEWQLCTTEGPTPVFKRFGGKGRAIVIDHD